MSWTRVRPLTLMAVLLLSFSGLQPEARATGAQPSVAYASYIGADGRNTAEKVVTDAAGNLYLTGWVEGANFPTPDGGPVELHGGVDVYVIKLSAAGTVVYATVFGGSQNDLARGLALDANGDAFVAGATYSSDFPLQNAVLATDVGAGAAFVTELDPTGHVVYSDVLGGNNFVGADDVAVDPAGGVYIGGFTLASNLPVTAGAFQATRRGPFDGFLAKLQPGLSGLAYCTYFGGGAHPAGGLTSNYDEIYAVAADDAGHAYVAGVTDSIDLPTTAGAAQTVPGGQRDAFVAEFAAGGGGLVYSTRVGGVGDDQASAMTVDRSGNAYLVGRTASPNFPTRSPVQLLPGSITDAFVTKVDPTGSAFLFSTYLGGSGTDYGYGVSVDDAGRATVVGQTASANFPTVAPFQARLKGTADGFVSRLSADGTSLEYSTYLGGSDWDGLTGVEATPQGVLVSGFMYSSDMPTSAATQTWFGAPYDGYVARIVDS